MRWLDDEPPKGDIWLTCFAAVFGVLILIGSVWIATGPAKSAEPPAWLVPTLVLPDGSHVTGARGWHPRKYPSSTACET